MNIFEGHIKDIPHLFVEKQVIAVNIQMAFLEQGRGLYAVPYSRCEVFAPIECMTKVNGNNLSL